MTAADRKRLMVLRNLGDVYGDRVYTSSSTSASVRVEVEWLLRRGLIEPEQRDEGTGYRMTDAGRVQLDEWEAAR